MNRVILWAAAWSICAGAAAAQQEQLPDIQTCMNIEIARFETALDRLRRRPVNDPTYDIGRVDGVEFCGTVAIVLCDRSDAPLPCQEALAQTQDAMHAQVLGQLPTPPRDEAAQGSMQLLYAKLWALAHGVSAGEDCAGTNETLRLWCEAREANRRLLLAVKAWQIARFQGAAPPAIEAGWAGPPPPVRPKARRL